MPVTGNPDADRTSSTTSTLHDVVLGPATHLEFVNADVIAAHNWPEDAAARSYDAAAVDAGYVVSPHVVLVPEALAVARVANRVDVGRPTVPEAKIRERYRRLWPLVAKAIVERVYSVGEAAWPPGHPKPCGAQAVQRRGAAVAILREPTRAGQRLRLGDRLRRGLAIVS